MLRILWFYSPLFYFSFDNIARIETMETDSKRILSLLDLDESVLKSSTQNAYSKEKPLKSVLEQYKDIPKQKLDLLVKRYARDMEILGYHFNPETFEATCAIDTPDGVCC